MKIELKKTPDNIPVISFLTENDFECVIQQELTNLKFPEKLSNYIVSRYKNNRSYREMIDNHSHQHKTCEVYDANQKYNEILNETINNFIDDNRTSLVQFMKNLYPVMPFKNRDKNSRFITKVISTIFAIMSIGCIGSITKTPSYLEYFIENVLED